MCEWLPLPAVSGGDRLRHPAHFVPANRCPSMVPLRTALVLLVVAIASRVGMAAEPPTISLEPHDSRGVFIISGLSPAELELIAARRDSPSWQRLFAVYAAKPAPDRPQMLGELKLMGAHLEFRPRFSLQPEVEYHAVYDPRVVHDADPAELAKDAVITGTFVLPKPDFPATCVTAIYPTADRLPENQLKFYLHFSAPMRRGAAYRHVRLLRESGDEVDLPFLELDEELWDPSGTRLTLLFDPGRIKRGLRPREEEGPILEEGHLYTLEIDSGWRDAHGSSLKAPTRKVFAVGPPDDVQPTLASWKLTRPAAGTQQPLRISFPEPLDHSLLQRVLRVVRATGEDVAGEVDVANEETTWTLRPAEPWAAGEYAVVVDSALEDRAGNSLRRPFEVDVFRNIEIGSDALVVSLPFRIE